MNRIFKSANYHVKKLLFEKYALPKTVNEKISKVILKKYLPANPVIIDCGAHDGSDTVELVRLFKNATIHSFEPITPLFEKLKAHSSTLKNVYAYQLALSNNNGWSEFHVSEGESDGSSSLLKPLEHLKDHPKTKFNKTIQVQTITLDDWSDKYNIAKVDLLWLDMQGFELNMLKASNRILRTVKVIHTEVSTRETYKGVPLYAEYRTFLEQHGFKAVIEAIPKGWDMGNVLFVRK